MDTQRYEKRMMIISNDVQRSKKTIFCADPELLQERKTCYSYTL